MKYATIFFVQEYLQDILYPVPLARLRSGGGPGKIKAERLALTDLLSKQKGRPRGHPIVSRGVASYTSHLQDTTTTSLTKKRGGMKMADLVHDVRLDALEGTSPAIFCVVQEDMKRVDAVAVAMMEAEDLLDMPFGGFPLRAPEQLLNDIDDLEDNGRSVPPLIFIPDATYESRKAIEEVANKLKYRGFITRVADVHDDDADVFFAAICKAHRRVMDDAARKDSDDGPTDAESKRVAQAERVASMLRGREGYRQRTAEGAYNRVPTGVNMIDDLLGGGLFPGLALFGARTGVGKTTLCLQMADAIAEGGRPVLYIALEMTADELAAKSIARIHNETADHAVSYSALLEHKVPSGVYPSAIQAAEDEYFSWAEKYLYVRDSWQDAVSVTRAARDIAEATGSAPVVFVDYLQILRTPDSHMTDKQAADANMMKLKDICRLLHTPVIAVSSLNRASYGGTVKDGSKSRRRTDDEWFDVFEGGFKESGGIEYTAEMQLGLRPLSRDESTRNLEQWEREMRLYLVKNRAGIGHKACNMIFDGRQGAFVQWSRQDSEAYNGEDVRALFESGKIV